jgi:hypothetical protein
MRRAVACVSSFGLMRLRFEVPPGWEHGLRVLHARHSDEIRQRERRWGTEHACAALRGA